jgi:hypothetical protein
MPSGTDLDIISQSWNIDGDITAGYTYPPGYTSLQQGAMKKGVSLRKGSA